MAPLSFQDPTMRLTEVLRTLSTVLIAACVSTRPTTEPAAVNAPNGGAVQPAPVAAPAVVQVVQPAQPKPRGESWIFSYAPGNYTYTLTTDATIALVRDTTQKHAVPQSSQQVAVAITGTGDVQVLQPASIISGSCDVNAALTMRAQQLIPKLPNHLLEGDRWRDSTLTTGCRGMIPAESTVISNYLIIGDTLFANTKALEIRRTDSLSANGIGVDGQHRILATATGTGSADLFLNVVTGRLISSRGSQTSLVSITTSGRLTQFIQHVTEIVTAAGP